MMMATLRRTSTRTPVKKVSRLRRVAARIAGLATRGAKRKCPPTPRKKHADLEDTRPMEDNHGPSWAL